MTLETWVKNAWLEKRDSDRDEIQRLIALADARLEDYQRAVAGKLSADVQLGLAYDAIRISATAALRSAGYRVVRGGSEHYVPGRQYRGLRGKVVDWVEHKFEEGRLYINVRFLDKTELCWRIATRMTIEEGDLSDWKSGDFEQMRVFVKNERDRSE